MVHNVYTDHLITTANGKRLYTTLYEYITITDAKTDLPSLSKVKGSSSLQIHSNFSEYV